MQRRITFFAITIVLCATCAWAQSQSVEIPFSFHVGEVELSPGLYYVSIGRPTVNAVTLDSSMGRAAFALAFDVGRQDFRTAQSKLIFVKYGPEEYFLRQIWDPLHPTMQLPKSQHELVTSKVVTGIRTEKVIIQAQLR